MEKVPNLSLWRGGVALRASAISMGFVFLMGGWRRFVNVPAKHDINTPASLASKLVEAAPGSPIEPVIHWVLAHPVVAEWSIYAMSTAEVLVGLGLILGLLTRLAATGSALLNIALMLIFGWMGYECLDEWTMAALGFAISVSVMIHGADTYSLDHALKRDDFSGVFTRNVCLGLTVMSVIFTVGFYSYYFGIFDFGKLTSTGSYHISVVESPGSAGQERLYVDAGPSSAFAYVTSITYTLDGGSKKTVDASDIDVLKSHFEPWAHNSGSLVDGVMKLRLGSMVDIRVPEAAVSATIHLLDNKDSVVRFRP
ncbi:TQO small subunit DoxD [Modicisalibacter tunisiensis]|uniref:DoxX family membrane protein n=1 Tax=Modicisalibacter tunisiensis TaxID=390637 RepID=A0ABS7X0C5_9GAMM|nr:TQO small subunit DoxD [Modicisalibacter tunisiensis]MBZ9567893.1 DoxX family membrane protein [Modicisalibacter tunisiensis]